MQIFRPADQRVKNSTILPNDYTPSLRADTTQYVRYSSTSIAWWSSYNRHLVEFMLDNIMILIQYWMHTRTGCWKHAYWYPKLDLLYDICLWSKKECYLCAWIINRMWQDRLAGGNPELFSSKIDWYNGTILCCIYKVTLMLLAYSHTHAEQGFQDSTWCTNYWQNCAASSTALLKITTHLDCYVVNTPSQRQILNWPGCQLLIVHMVRGTNWPLQHLMYTFSMKSATNRTALLKISMQLAWYVLNSLSKRPILNWHGCWLLIVNILKVHKLAHFRTWLTKSHKTLPQSTPCFSKSPCA